MLTCTVEFGATLDCSGDDVDATRHLPLERSLNSQGGKSFQSSLSVIDGEHSKHCCLHYPPSVAAAAAAAAPIAGTAKTNIAKVCIIGCSSCSFHFQGLLPPDLMMLYWREHFCSAVVNLTLFQSH